MSDQSMTNTTMSQLPQPPYHDPSKFKVILETVVGSTLHGTHVNDGLEDLDLMAVVIERPEVFCGFHHDPKSQLHGTTLHAPPQDTWVWRSKPEGVRSEAGDIDWVGYGYRKYLSLVLKGNPTAMLPLFAPKESMRAVTWEGLHLRGLVPYIISKKIYSAYRGYIQAQRDRLLGNRGQRNVTRPELIERYGFDTKYASHIVRLARQGQELLLRGELTLPMKEDDRRFCVDIRLGQFSLQEVISIIDEEEAALTAAYERSELQEQPNIQEVEDLMVQLYQKSWEYDAQKEL